MNPPSSRGRRLKWTRLTQGYQIPLSFSCDSGARAGLEPLIIWPPCPPLPPPFPATPCGALLYSSCWRKWNWNSGVCERGGLLYPCRRPPHLQFMSEPAPKWGYPYFDSISLVGECPIFSGARKVESNFRSGNRNLTHENLAQKKLGTRRQAKSN